MPKNQSRAAQLARRIQAVTGLTYTECLKLCEPSAGCWTVLARELHAAGLTAAADNLLGVAAVNAEAGSWYEAGGHVQGLFYGTDEYARGERVMRACGDAAEAALARAGFESNTFGVEAEAYHAAFLALVQAGTVPDGTVLARAALGVLDDDPMYCSDIVRCRGRAAFTYATTVLGGPRTPTAVAARKAARAMAAAAAVRTGGDEEWFEAAGHMVEAVWHGCVAAGLAPLQGHGEHRDFLKGELGGVLPAG